MRTSLLMYGKKCRSPHSSLAAAGRKRRMLLPRQPGSRIFRRKGGFCAPPRKRHPTTAAAEPLFTDITKARGKTWRKRGELSVAISFVVLHFRRIWRINWAWRALLSSSFNTKGRPANQGCPHFFPRPLFKVSRHDKGSFSDDLWRGDRLLLYRRTEGSLAGGGPFNGRVGRGQDSRPVTVVLTESGEEGEEQQ